MLMGNSCPECKGWSSDAWIQRNLWQTDASRQGMGAKYEKCRGFMLALVPEKFLVQPQ